MSIADLAKSASKFAGDNAPVILTAVGVAGTVATAVLSVRATIKATRKVDEAIRIASFKEGESFTKWDTFKLVWLNYVPPVAVGGLTIGAIIFSNRISTKRLGAVAAAATIAERAHSEYKDKVKEMLGNKKAEEVQDEVAKDNIARAGMGGRNEIIIAGDQESIFFDGLSNRFFKSDMETVRKAQNDLNSEINNSTYVNVSDLYDKLGLSHTDISDSLGWNNMEMIDLHFNPVIPEKGPYAGRAVINIGYRVLPFRDYGHLH